jgi:RNA polymerase sigma factor (sigma-70 family)
MKQYREWSELKLFHAIGQGDEKALTEFKSRIERCARALWKKQYGSIMETKIEQICERVLGKFEALRLRGFTGGNQAFRTYLYKAVASGAVEARREQHRHVSLDQPIDMPNGETKVLRDLAEGMIDPHWSALDQLELKEEQNRVREAFARLDKRCQELLWAKEVEKRSEQEISTRLQMTLGNVWASLYRCKERLYRLLLVAFCAGSAQEWGAKVSRLAEKLPEPLATVFRLWWEEKRTIREIAITTRRDEREAKELLSRAKAGVWQLAQETGTL